VTVMSFYIRRHVGGTQLLHKCYVINVHMLKNFCVNYTL